jgi:hypothetical protein
VDSNTEHCALTTDSRHLWRASPQAAAHTATVEQPEPFDLVLLNGKPDPWGAHVGVYLGKRLVLHLCKKIGIPAIESLGSLMQRPKYRYLIGFKRILKNRNLERA